MGQGLFFFFLDWHRFKVLGLEDLMAIEALNVIDPVSSGDDFGTRMVTSGLHS